MKRKVYVKQMKMLRNKSKLKEQEQDGCEDPAHSSSSDSTAAVPPSNAEMSRVVEDGDPSLPSSSSPAMSTPTTVSSSGWVPQSPNPFPNTIPLPKVDVLMKSSSLRAFQLRQTQNPHAAENLTQPSSHLNEDDESVQAFQREEEATLTYMDNRVNQENMNLQGWQKDCSLVEQNSNLSPRSIHSPPYGVDYSDPYRVNLEQGENYTNDDQNVPASSPSPVFHQLQASRINDESLNPEMGSRIGGFPGHKPGDQRGPQIHHPYNIHVAEPRGMHQHQAADIPRYNHDSTHRIQDEQLLAHGQVRAWEQENYRYVDFTWRHEEDQMDSKEYYSSSGDDEDDDLIDSNVSDESTSLRSKTTRSHKAGGGSGSGRRRRKRVQTPVQRSAANTRERRRMLHLNVAFDYLKEHLPNVKDKKKLSRIQTLKAAIYYIHLLQDSLSVH